MLDSTASSLLFFFDAPTDRAAMPSGRTACAPALDDATLALMQGASTAAPQCEWQADNVLRALLSVQSTLRPGDVLSVREGAVGPRVEPRAGRCAQRGLCATQSVTLNASAPCQGGCPAPVARVSGPVQVSSCEGTTLELDGSSSESGGYAPLSAYAWMLEASAFENATEAAALRVRLAALPANASVLSLAYEELAAAFGSGSTLEVSLAVTSALGASSLSASWAVARLAGPAPSLVIDGPLSRSVRAAVPLSVRAVATAASCWGGAARIEYSWALIAVTTTATGALPGDAADLIADALSYASAVALRSPTLYLPAGAMRGDLTYRFAMTATMADSLASPPATAAVAVSARSEPLAVVVAGGDRTVSANAALFVDASSTQDPRPVGAREPPLEFAWSLFSLPDASEAAWLEGVDTASSTLTVPAGALAAGRYEVRLNVTVVSSAGIRSSEQASLVATMLDGIGPTVSLLPLGGGSSASYKPSATWTTRSGALSFVSALDAGSAALGVDAWDYSWAVLLPSTSLDSTADGEAAEMWVPAADLALTDTLAVTTTGAALPNLAFRSGALVPGSVYRFELTVAAREGSAAAAAGYIYSGVTSATVTLNAPPFGGALSLKPAAGEAIVTRFVLRASGWSDEATDLPLAYSFSLLSEASALRQALGLGANDTSDSATATLVEQLGETASPLTAESASSSARAIFPEGEHALVVRVRDAYGASALTGKTVAVTASSLDCLGAVQVASEAQAAVDAGDNDGARQYAAALAPIVTAACTQVGTAQVGAQSADGLANAAIAAESLLAVTLAAAAREAPTAASVKNAAPTLAAVLSMAPEALGASTLSNGLGQVAALATAAKTSGEGVEQTTANLMVGAASAALGGAGLSGGADGSIGSAAANSRRAKLALSANASDVAAARASARSAAGSIANALLGGAVAGEAPSEVRSERLSISSARVDAASLGELGGQFASPALSGASTAATNTSAGSGATLPTGLLSGFTAELLASGVDVLQFTSSSNLHDDVGSSSSAADEGGTTLLALETPLFSLALGSAASGSGLSIRGLPDESRISFTLTTTGGSDGGASNGTTDEFNSTATELRCFFWNDSAQTWSDDGVKTLDSGSGVIWCSSAHLTDFAGIRVPSSLEDIEESATSLTINTLSVDDFAVLGDVQVGDNPWIYGVVIAIGCANALTLLVCATRDWYEAEARKRRRMQYNLGTAQKLRPEAGGADAAIDVLEKRLDELDAAIAERAHAASAVIQRHYRRRMRRPQFGSGSVAAESSGTVAPMPEASGPPAGSADDARTAEAGAAARRGAGDHKLTRLLRLVVKSVGTDHSVLGMLFASAELYERAEQAQVFWTVAMAGIVLTCMFYSEASAVGSDGVEIQIDIVQAVIIATITGCILTPATFCTRSILRWGYSRRSGPLTQRIFGAMLASDAEIAAMKRTPFKRSVALFVAHRSGAPRRIQVWAEEVPTGETEQTVDSVGRPAPPSLSPAADLPGELVSAQEAHILPSLTIDKESQRLLLHKFTMYDVSRTGTLDVREFGAFLYDMGFRLSKGKVRELVAQLDRNDDEVISRGELLRWYDRMVAEEAARTLRRLRGLGGALRWLAGRLVLPPGVRLVVAWLIVWAMVVAMGMLSIVYGRSFGNDKTTLMFTSWGVGEVQSLGVEEPFIIAMAILGPAALGSCSERLDGRLDWVISEVFGFLRCLC